MQRSSESIASLAAALAKAQIELSNPEKSLLGTIKTGPGDSPERVFRYAPLSSGLDIVRKTLGQHEIATVQTTAIDQAAGIVNLTTVLAHASGEWIASDWPVCAISETATPRRMGAALTYARRYALFTLVGIAGEDDLDAPDLIAPTTSSTSVEKYNGSVNAGLNGGGHSRPAHRSTIRGHGKDLGNLPAASVLAPEASAQLRDRLLMELKDLCDGDDAARWAKRSLPEKSKLTAVDAQHVEETFRAKLVSFTAASRDAPDALRPIEQPVAARETSKVRKRSNSKSIDKSVLTLPEPRRVRDRHHVRYVAKQPCLICGRQPSDAHHLRFTQSRALGRKVSDEFTVPLCRGHHREVHHCGDEVKWWKAAGVDPTINANVLWRETHPLARGRDKTGSNRPAVLAGPTGRQDLKHKTKPIMPVTPR